MIFNPLKVYSVQRKGKDMIYPVTVYIRDYEEISRKPIFEEKHNEIFLDFYDQLKKRGRIVNCRYRSVRSEYLPAIAELISKNGKKPDTILVSNIETYNKVKQESSSTNINSIFDEIDNTDHLFVFKDPPIDKEFIIFTYSYVKDIAIHLRYDEKTRELVLEAPIYKDEGYDDSHYNYYYGLKLHD